MSTEKVSTRRPIRGVIARDAYAYENNSRRGATTLVRKTENLNNEMHGAVPQCIARDHRRAASLCSSHVNKEVDCSIVQVNKDKSDCAVKSRVKLKCRTLRVGGVFERRKERTRDLSSSESETSGESESESETSSEIKSNQIHEAIVSVAERSVVKKQSKTNSVVDYINDESSEIDQQSSRDPSVRSCERHKTGEYRQKEEERLQRRSRVARAEKKRTTISAGRCSAPEAEERKEQEKERRNQEEKEREKQREQEEEDKRRWRRREISVENAPRYIRQVAKERRLREESELRESIKEDRAKILGRNTLSAMMSLRREIALGQSRGETSREVQRRVEAELDEEQRQKDRAGVEKALRAMEQRRPERERRDRERLLRLKEEAEKLRALRRKEQLDRTRETARVRQECLRRSRRPDLLEVVYRGRGQYTTRSINKDDHPDAALRGFSRTVPYTFRRDVVSAKSFLSMV